MIRKYLLILVALFILNGIYYSQNSDSSAIILDSQDTIIKVDDEIKEKKDLERVILCDVQNKIFPELEKSFLNLIHNSGHPDIKLEKKIDFDKLYNEKFN